MSGPATHDASAPHGWRLPSVHFVNNVLAAAAGAIEDDPALARDTLARLGAYLSVRMRATPVPTTLSDELEHVSTYLALEQARFPDRIEPAVITDAPVADVPAGVLQAFVQERLGMRLDDRPGPCRVRARVIGGTFVLDLSDLPDGEAPARYQLELAACRV